MARKMAVALKEVRLGQAANALLPRDGSMSPTFNGSNWVRSNIERRRD
jgi:hypothetical protein